MKRFLVKLKDIALLLGGLSFVAAGNPLGIYGLLSMSRLNILFSENKNEISKTASFKANLIGLISALPCYPLIFLLLTGTSVVASVPVLTLLQIFGTISLGSMFMGKIINDETYYASVEEEKKWKEENERLEKENISKGLELTKGNKTIEELRKIISDKITPETGTEARRVEREYDK